MRPLTDLLYISREKLSFIVDATAAPIASLLPVSSWVGFEVGLIQDELDSTCAGVRPTRAEL
jgi:Na+/H+ antiporter NhaC